MGLIQSIKNELKASRINREFENDPEIVHKRLSDERARVKGEVIKLREQKQFESEKQELKDLRSSTGLRGKIKEGLSAVRSHLDSVKAKNNAKSFKLKDPKAGAMNSVGSFNMPGARGIHDSPKGSRGMHESSGSGYRPFGSGVMGDQKPIAPKKKKQGKTIIIRL